MLECGHPAPLSMSQQRRFATQCELCNLQAKLAEVEAERDRLREALANFHAIVGQTITFEGGLHYIINAWDYDDLRGA